MISMAEKRPAVQAGKAATDAPWRRWSRIALGVTMTAFLAACQSIVPKTVEPTPEVVAPVEPEVVTSGIPTDTTHHRIALLVPLSGKNAGVGQSLANATTMALLDTNAANLRMTTYDTAKGVAAAAQAAVNDGNKLILGPLLGEEVTVTANIAKAGNVPILTFSNDIGVAGNNVFLLGHIPSQSVDRIVRYAYGKGMKRFAAMVPNGDYGQRASQTLIRSAKDVGATVVSIQTFNRDSASVNAAAKNLSANGDYDAVLIAENGEMALKIGPAIRANNSTAKFLGTELWNTSGALAGSPTMRGAWFASVSDTLYRQYATKYRARFGTSPFRLSSLGYDSVLLTVKVARNWKIGTPFPLQQLTDTGGFVGLDGVFRFRTDGVSERALEVQQINAGSFSIVDPAPGGF